MGAGFTTPFNSGYAVPIVLEASTWLRQQNRRRAVQLGLQVGSGRISTMRYALAAILTSIALKGCDINAQCQGFDFWALKPPDGLHWLKKLELCHEGLPFHITTRALGQKGTSQNPRKLQYQDPPCTFNWGYMVPNSGYLGPNRG